MSVPARLEHYQAAKSRTAIRRKLRLGSVLAGSADEVTIHDLSVTGFCIETSANLSPGEALQVELPESPVVPAHVVWSDGRFHGCRFAVEIRAATISAALLRGAAIPTEPRPETLAAITDRISDEAGEDEHYSLRARLFVIFGLSAALWVLIGLAIAAVT